MCYIPVVLALNQICSERLCVDWALEVNIWKSAKTQRRWLGKPSISISNVSKVSKSISTIIELHPNKIFIFLVSSLYFTKFCFQ